MPGAESASGIQYPPLGGADAAARDTGWDDPDEQLPVPRCPGLDARAADRIQLISRNVMGWPLNEHAPAPPCGRVDLIDLERDLVVGVRDPGPQVLIQRAVLRSAEHDRTAAQFVVHRQHGRPEPADVGDPADPAWRY